MNCRAVLASEKEGMDMTLMAEKKAKLIPLACLWLLDFSATETANDLEWRKEA